ncbi:hypothetical protein WR25_13460 [Diploscapter pachys]|uniref:Uncharacterized protein n=1 Tax=Diploscapter pachys TaxID=2018661 RepID=A0A2A2KGH1_9BILA|nr:hypothetical protein WR25_13460 [Diploscapter pachys]
MPKLSNWAIWRIKLKLKDSVELPIGSRAERQQSRSRRCGLKGERDLGVETQQSENTKIDANWRWKRQAEKQGYNLGSDPFDTFTKLFGARGFSLEYLSDKEQVKKDFFQGNPNNLQKNPPVEVDLEVSKELLEKGGQVTKEFTRKTLMDIKTKELEDATVPLILNIGPGTPNLSRFSFPCMGDQAPGKFPADVIVIVHAK